MQDRIRGMTGADEYVGKPYDIRYLVVKVQELHHARTGQRILSLPTDLPIGASLRITWLQQICHSVDA